MAGQRPLRSTQRRNTPQSPVKSQSIVSSPQVRVQVRRSTRSQTNGITGDSESEATSKRIRKGQHVIRESSSESFVGEGERNARQSTRDRHLNSLPTVTENAIVGYPTIPTNSGDDEFLSAVDDDEVLRKDGHHVKSPGNISTTSGTTARTSYSAQELRDLDSEEMLDSLPSLNHGADEVLRFLTSQENTPESLEKHVKDLQRPSTRRGKHLIRLGDFLQVYKKPFGNELYANISILARGLLGVRHITSLGIGPWRPDDIFYKANIATMMVHILSTQGDPAKVYSTVEKLERNFASPFLSKLLTAGPQIGTFIGESRLSDESFELALELRTQYLITLLHRHLHQPNFDPDIILSQVFYEDDSTLKGWDSEGLSIQDIDSANRSRILERIKQIKSTFNEDTQVLQAGQVVELDKLNATFPWSRFVVKALLWSQLRQDEIEAHLKLVNGVEGIKVAIEDKIRHRVLSPLQDNAGNNGDNGLLVQLDFEPSEISHGTSDIAEMPQDVPRTALKRLSGRQYDSPRDARSLREVLAATAAKLATQRKAQGQGTSSAAALTQSTPQAGISPSSTNTRDVPLTAPANANELATIGKPSDDPQPLQDDDEVIPHEDVESSPTNRILEIAAQTAAEQDKENLPQRPKSSPRRLAGPSLLDKQPNAKRVAFDSQLSMHQGPSARSKYQQLIAEVERDPADQISSPSEDEGFEVDQRPQFSRPSLAPTSTNRVNLAHASRSSAKRPRLPRERQSSTALDEDYRDMRARSSEEPNPSQSDFYRAVNKRSRLVTAQNSPKKIQTRRAWSAEEIETLIELIEQHGHSYALIKTMDTRNVLEHRSQVDIKDKARNMKFDYIRSRMTLPHNFEHIPLNKPLIERLLGAGIEEDELRAVGVSI